MPRSRTLLPLLVALPAVVAALLGTLHPIFLTPETAERWKTAHLLLLPVFPLIAGAFWLLLRGESGPLAWVARLAGYGWAVLYGALDAIAGIGAPQQVIRSGADVPLGDLYEIGDQLGHLGVLGLGVSGLLTALVLFLRGRSPWAAVGAVAVLVGCYGVYENHVFPSKGVLSMLLVAGGTAALAVAAARQVDAPQR